jgi:hypothetical protein
MLIKKFPVEETFCLAIAEASDDDSCSTMSILDFESWRATVTVAPKRLGIDNPGADLQYKAASDAQIEFKQVDAPIFNLKVLDVCPKKDPRIMKIDEPVVGMD